MKKFLIDYRICISYIICLLFSCCNGTSTRHKLEIMQSIPVNLNLEKMECWMNDSLLEIRTWENTPLKLCVYVGPDYCTSCYLKKMFQWEDFIEMEKGGEFFIYFIFTPQEGCENNFHRFFYQAELNHPFYIDKNKEFLTLNPHIPQEAPFHTFLLNENNNVILVGDVLHNETIENKFRNILHEMSSSEN